MSTERLERLRQELAKVMAEELTAVTEAAAAQQRIRAARKEITVRSKRLREAEQEAAAQAALTSPHPRHPSLI